MKNITALTTAVVAAAASTAAAEETHFGDWTFVTKVNQVTLEQNAYIRSKATETNMIVMPVMRLGCEQLYFDHTYGMNEGVLYIREASQPEATEIFVDQGNSGIYARFIEHEDLQMFWSGYQDAFVVLIEGSQLYVQFGSSATTPQQATFSLNGFTDAVGSLAAVCLTS